MKRLSTTVKRESYETLDDVQDQLPDKVEDLDLEFEDSSFSDDDDINLVDDDDINSVDDDDSYYSSE